MQTMQLYKISEDFRALMARVDDEDGVLDETLEAALDALGGALTDKVDSCAVVMAEMDAEDAALEREIARLQARRAVAAKGRTRLADYVRRCLEVAGQRKVKGARFTVSLRASQSINVTCGITHLPAEFVRTTTPLPVSSPDKVALKAALAAGRVIDGVELVTKESVVLK